MSGTPIYSHGRRVGTVTGDTLNKTIHGTRHFLRQPPGIALAVAELDAAAAAGAKTVCVKDIETGVRYTATIEHIRGAGIPINRGFGAQLALPFAGWITTTRGADPDRTQPAQPNAPRQLSLLLEVLK